MGVFDVAQSVVNSASGVIVGDTSIDISTAVADLEDTLENMELGELFGLWFQSLFVGITMHAITICVFLVTYGRMIEIYLVTSVAPIPMATMMNREAGGMGQNYLRSLFALGFQAFLIIVCVAIYAVLVQTISVSGEIDGHVIQLDLPELKELVSLLRNTSNNINQIAKRVNSTGRIYSEDLSGIKDSMESLWTAANNILRRLASIP